ncbi:MAG: hypothetical protein ACP5HS_02165 [Anaerolineae bacterium]
MPDEFRALFDEELVFNGVNAVTGDYGQPPLSTEKLARLIQGAPLPEDYRDFVEYQKRLAALAKIDERLTRVTQPQLELHNSRKAVRLEELKVKAREQAKWPVKPGAGDPTRVEDVGWGLIFPAAMHPRLREEIREALKPLLDHRHEQAGDLFRLYEGGDAYRQGERKDQFLGRLGVGPGLVDPREMPFYILLVGTPEEIPYGFQYQLDVMRGVGRLDFGSDVEAYHAYAQAVVAAERGGVALPRRAALFATANPGDRATQVSARYLVEPLYQNLIGATPAGELALSHEWEFLPLYLGDGLATWSQLEQLLGGNPAQKPALLFTASHGIEFPAGHPAQLRHQGALLCQDWPGPKADVRREHYFTADDVSAEANLAGMVAFMFACYGAGTPELDQFAFEAFKVREKIAPRAFTAALPQRMLLQGALAVLGHVERAWGYSFVSPVGGIENQSFITAMRMLMNGKPVGLATDVSFDMRYAEMSSDLSADLEELQWDPEYLSSAELAHRWTASNDARSYVVLGDPAVRIPLLPEEGPPKEEESEVGGEVAPTVTLPEEEPEAPAEEEPEARADVTTVVAPPETVPKSLVEDEPKAPSGEGEGLEAQAVAPKAWVSKPRARVVRSEVEAPPWVSPTLGPTEPVYLTREEAAVAFGLSDQFERLRESLEAFTDQLATSLRQAADDIVTLDVRTYTTSDLARASTALERQEAVEATLRALTRVSFDGDLQVYVPERVENEVDQVLWMIHKAMVEEAQESRAKFLATMAELATRLLDILRIGS